MTVTEADALARDYLKFALDVGRNFCPLSHLKDEAESVALMGLEEAIRTRHGIRAVTLASWVGAIVGRRVKDLLRSETRRGRHGRRPAPLSVPITDQIADPRVAAVHARSEAFEHLIAPLAPAEKQIFYLVFVEGFRLCEAAQVVGLGKSAAQRHYHAALARLRTTSDVWTGRLDTASLAKPVTGSAGRIGVKAP